MRAVQLDLLQIQRRSDQGGVVLLTLGLAVAVAVFSIHGSLKNEAGLLDSRIARLDRRVYAIGSTDLRIDESMRQEIGRANELIDQLTLPWDGLFHAIEAASGEGVTLRGVAPDAKSGTVQITAEATDWGVMFDYLEKLGQQPELAHIYLLQHQRELRKEARPIQFIVKASWPH